MKTTGPAGQEDDAPGGAFLMALGNLYLKVNAENRNHNS